MIEICIFILNQCSVTDNKVINYTTYNSRDDFISMILLHFQLQKGVLSVPRSDGDTIRVYVKAFDIVGNTAVDSVLVHVDTSHPVIDHIWLTKDGYKQLAVHNSMDLSEMT